LSDLHANIFAVRKVFDDIDDEGVETILIAGDLIGYYYWPLEVVQLCMNDKRVKSIQGNHEQNLKLALSCKNKMLELSKIYGSCYKICKKTLSINELDWLLSLPIKLVSEHENVSFFLSHGSLTSSNQYIYPNAPTQKLKSNYSKEDITVFGHTHHSFIHAQGEKMLLNPGSVGQPRDIGNLASYVIMDTTSKVVKFKKIPFNVQPIISKAIKIDPGITYLQDVLLRGSSEYSR
tara:strand:+ start:6316 stop:7017 length:702 start_codon:yes stop_codon:yes gene_type:complete